MAYQFLKLARKRSRSFLRKEDGTVAIEFGLVTPAFLLLFFSMVETAGMMFQEYALQAGVHEAARMIRTGQAQNGAWTPTSFKTKVCEVAKVVQNCNSKLRIHVNAKTTFASMAATAPKTNEVGASEDGTDKNIQFTCGVPQQVVAVIVTYDHYFITPGMSLFRNTPSTQYRRLEATAMFRNEPFAATGAACGPDV